MAENPSTQSNLFKKPSNDNVIRAAFVLFYFVSIYCGTMPQTEREIKLQ